MPKQRIRREGRWFRIIGVVGISATFVMNFVSWVAMDQQGAEPFTNDWWGSWFPSYPFWGVFLLVGFLGRRRIVENPLEIEEVTGAKTTLEPDPVSRQFIFDRVFKIYVAKYGKETQAQIIQAMGAVLRSKAEALLLFEECEDVGNDARHFMRLKVFGQMTWAAVRMELMKEHPNLSVTSLDLAMEFGEAQVPKE